MVNNKKSPSLPFSFFRVLLLAPLLAESLSRLCLYFYQELKFNFFYKSFGVIVNCMSNRPLEYSRS